MSILLDTCVVSELIKPAPDARVISWTEATPQDLCFLSAITLGELVGGGRSDRRDRAPPRAEDRDA